MDTNKVIAAAARAMQMVADRTARELSTIRYNPSLPGDLLMQMAKKAGQTTEGAKQAIRRARSDARDIMKGFIPSSYLVPYIDENGNVRQSLVEPPQVIELESFQKSYFLVIEKLDAEAGWDNSKPFQSGNISQSRLVLNCSSCGARTYVWTVPSLALKYGQSLCAACLSRHLEKAHSC
jgi:hypothetical protein